MRRADAHVGGARARGWAREAALEHGERGAADVPEGFAQPFIAKYDDVFHKTKFAAEVNEAGGGRRFLREGKKKKENKKHAEATHNSAAAMDLPSDKHPTHGSALLYDLKDVY